MKYLLAVLSLAFMAGCTTHQYAKNVKTASFDPEPKRGQSLGPSEGADCTWTVLGYRLGGDPTLDKAFANAKRQKSSSITDALGGSEGNGDVRYLENVSTEKSGFNAYVVGKECLVVKGVAYR